MATSSSFVYQIGLGIVVGFIFLVIFAFIVLLLATLLFGNITVTSLASLNPATITTASVS